MAVSYGALTAIGASGRGYYIDIYLDDAAGSYANISAGSGAAAGTPEKWIPPEDVILTDLLIVSATTQTKTQVLIGGTSNNDILRNSLHIPTATMIMRPTLRIPVPRGIELILNQLA